MSKKIFVFSLGLLVGVAAGFVFFVARFGPPKIDHPVEILQFNRALQPGEILEKEHVTGVVLPKSLLERLGNVVPAGNVPFNLHWRIAAPVNAGQWVTWNLIAPQEEDVELALEIAPPTAILRPGGAVHLVGLVALDDGPARYCRIIRNVTFKGYLHPEQSVPGKGSSTAILVVMDSGLSVKLRNILTHLEGKLHVEVSKHPKLSYQGTALNSDEPGLLKLAQAASTRPTD